MDILTFPYNPAYVPSAPEIECELSRTGRARGTVRLTALVDSGADGTFLPISVLDRIQARYVGQARLQRGQSESEIVDVYMVNLAIGDKTLPAVQVVATPDDAEPLIGRNVLNQLVITLNGPASVTELSD